MTVSTPGRRLRLTLIRRSGPYSAGRRVWVCRSGGWRRASRARFSHTSWTWMPGGRKARPSLRARARGGTPGPPRLLNRASGRGLPDPTLLCWPRRRMVLKEILLIAIDQEGISLKKIELEKARLSIVLPTLYGG